MTVIIENVFLFNIGLIIGLGTVFAYLAKLLKQPLILGYVLAGLVIGPISAVLMGKAIVENTSDIATLSELGISFLLFGAATHIDLKKLRMVGKTSVLAGVLQVGLTFAFGFMLVYLLNFSKTTAVYLGLVLAFSSTMVVVKILSDTKKINTLHGRLMIGILIVQDLLVIIAISMLDTLAGEFSAYAIIDTMIYGFGLFCIAVLANVYIINRLLRYVAKTKELLFLTAISICFAFMGIARYLDFSIAIGAFVAGLGLSVFEYNIEIGGEVSQIRDFFSTIFFVTLGLQINLMLAPQYLWLTLLLISCVLIIKPLITAMIYLLLGYGGRVSLTTGMGIGQVSEFAFILAIAGLAAGQINADLLSVITITTITTIVATPYLMKFDGNIYSLLLKMHGVLKLKQRHFFHRSVPGEEEEEINLKNHIILIGADRMGQRIIRKLIRKQKVLVIDFNPEAILLAKQYGIKALYGDALNDSVLEEADASKADIVIMTLPNENEEAAIIHKIKRMNKSVKIVCRADYPHEAVMLYKRGADIVVLPELIAGKKVGKWVNSIALGKKNIEKSKREHLEYLRREIPADEYRRLEKLVL